MFRQGLRQIAVSRVVLSQPLRPLSYSIIARKSVVDLAKEVLEKANKKTGEFLAGTMETAEKVAPTSENIKEAAEEVNLKTGRVLADGMQKAEDVAQDVKETVSGKSAEQLAKDGVDKVKEGAEKVNQKTGEVLSEGMQKAEDLKDGAQDFAKKVKNDTEDKASELKDKAEDKASELKDDAESVADKAKYKAEEAKGKAADWAEETASEVKEKADEIGDDVDGLTSKSREQRRVERNAKGFKDLQDKGAHMEAEQNRPDDGI